MATGLQLLVKPLGVATTRPEGSVSVNATPLKAMPALGLVTMKVKLVVPLSAIVAAPNDLLRDGGDTPTETLAEAVFPVPPSVELTGPLVLFFTPTVVPVTLML